MVAESMIAKGKALDLSDVILNKQRNIAIIQNVRCECSHVVSLFSSYAHSVFQMTLWIPSIYADC